MPLNTVLIGFGYWGPNLARNIIENVNYHLVAIIEVDKNRANIARTKFRCQVISQITDLPDLSTIDIAFIATRPGNHKEITTFLIELGINCVISKPFALSFNEADQICSLSMRNRVKVYCDYTYIYSDNFKFVEEWSGKSDSLISITSIRCSLGIIQSDVDVIADLASHDFSMIYRIKKCLPKSISAIDASPISKSDKTTAAMLVLHWEDGFVASIFVSWNAPKKVRKMTFMKINSAISIDETDLPQQLVISQFLENSFIGSKNEVEDFKRRNIRYSLGEDIIPIIHRNESLANELNAIAKDFIGGKSDFSIVSISEVLDIWKMIEAAQKSISSKSIGIKP
jgi:predicted dehydrogenase